MGCTTSKNMVTLRSDAKNKPKQLPTNGEATESGKTGTTSQSSGYGYGTVETTGLVAQLERYDRCEGTTETAYKLDFKVEGASNVFLRRDRKAHGNDGIIFRMSVLDKDLCPRFTCVESEPIFDTKGFPKFEISISLKGVVDTDILKFSLIKSYFHSTTKTKLGRTVISVKDFRSKTSWPDVWLFSKTGVAIFDKRLQNPSTIQISSIEVEELVGVDLESLREPSTMDSELTLEIPGSGEDEKDFETGSLHSMLTLTRSTKALLSGSQLKRPESPKTPDASDHGSDDETGTIFEGEDDEDEDDLEVEEAKEQDVKVEEDTTTNAADQGEKETAEKNENEGKHVLVITRGTRGDVQPFVALARGLAEQFGWKVTICTELRYRPFIMAYSNVSRGEVHYVPSGGDTEARIEKPIAKWAVHTKMNWLHAVMLARTEREFFDSEPGFFYWANKLKPDLLLYTFVTANITMIISEALKIPMVGFFLQPTVLPSKQYPALAPLDSEAFDNEVDQLKSHDLEGHRTFKFIKRAMENNVFTGRLNEMRKRRGLKPTNRRINDFEIITKQGFPLIVPIKAEAFGGHPDDWPESSMMTDFIFLRTGGVPPLADDIEAFIKNSQDKGNPVMTVCFSSMPVSRIKILESALLILDKCPEPYKPSVLALIGNRPDNEPKNEAQEAAAKKYVEEGRLMIKGGAPFSRLFPKLDFIVLHGGLGTTAEALAAGKPAMVTGVLLFDQRFWGKRLYDLGVGPPPCHITDFNSNILDILPKVFAPDSTYKKKAIEVAERMFPGGVEKMSDGVEANCNAVMEAFKVSFPAKRDADQ